MNKTNSYYQGSSAYHKEIPRQQKNCNTTTATWKRIQNANAKLFQYEKESVTLGIQGNFNG